jgi:glycosyltransferase involved in cell wall biosynthesis
VYDAGPGEAARDVVDARVTLWRPDLLLAMDPLLGEYVRDVPCLRAVDIAAEYYLCIKRMLRLVPPATRPLWWLRARKWSAYTAALAQSVAWWSVPSPVDRRSLLQQLPRERPVLVVPNGVDLAANQFAPNPAPPPVVAYCGAMSYEPNRDAVLYFCRTIWPLIRTHVPEAEFWITGDASAAPEELRRVPGVTLTGYLPEVNSLLTQCCATVVPLRLGVGTRLKIVEAMALGTPVVATSIGAEGLAVTDGADILLADDPERFAQHVITLIRSPALRARLSQAGRAVVEGTYAWDVIGAAFRTAVEELVRSHRTMPVTA